MAGSRLKQREYEMSLEYPVMPERKYSKNTRMFLDRGVQRYIRADLIQPTWNNFNNNIM